MAGQRAPLWRRPIVPLVAAATALVLIAGGWYISRGPSEVSVDRAVEDFRAGDETPATGAPAAPKARRATSKAAPAARDAADPAKPAAVAAPPEASQTTGYETPRPGVYVYATKGYEETDALSGSRHNYPSETTVTIRKGGCGWLSRWQPLEERWEENELCESLQGTRMATYSMYHEFFRRGIRENFKCDGFVQKVGARAGDSWSMVCKSPQSTAKSKNTDIGMETIEVAGDSVKVLHMRYDITVSGDNSGRMVQDRWLADEPRTLVRMTQKANLKVDSPFGKTGYRESLRIDLKSLQPRT